MRENHWNTYPVISALVLAASGVLFILNGFYWYEKVQSLEKTQMGIAAASALWILGCALTSRTRHASWTKGILCGLLFLPGLIILILTTGGKSRQEIWQEANPQLVGRNLRRQYRDVKPLY